MGRNMTKRKAMYRLVFFLMIACFIPICLVGAKTSAKKIKLNKKSVTLRIGQSVKVKVLHVSKKEKIKWTVQNKKIAAVKKGKITGKKKGRTKVIAKIGKKKLVCKVVVKASDKKKTPVKETPTPVPSVPLKTPVPTMTAPPDSKPYEEGLFSGTEEDFHKYFEKDSKNYTKRPEEVPAGEVKTIHYDSAVVGAAREAYVYTPPGYQQGTKYPVVYMLHGIGCDGGQWISISIANVLDNMIARQEIKPIVAVFPSVIPKDGINKVTLSQENIEAFTKFKDEFTQDLEPYILSHYSVSEDRKDTGVCGLSMGGMEALELGFSLQNRFNYIGSFSAAPSLDMSVLHYTDVNTIPELVLLCNGTKDSTVGDNPLNYHKELTRNGVKHIWYQYPGGGHSTPVWINGVINFLSWSYCK